MTSTTLTSAANRNRTRRVRSTAGFTLVELLVVVAIIGVLVAIVAASLAKVSSAGRSVQCMNGLRTVAFQFMDFADDQQRTYRGDSDRFGRNAFRIEDFQEKLYGIDEFWDGTARQVTLNPQQQPLMCPAATGPLVRRRGLACSEYAVTPTDNVSVGFNMRLDRISTSTGGWARLKRVRLSSRILERPWVPLVFDVDGASATGRGVLPYYSAPPAGDIGLYGSGRFWFPSLRHSGKLNAAFVGGHVLSSRIPEEASQWRWAYEPPEN